MMTFDRQQLAEILDLPYYVIKYWTTGRPFKITPSIRAPEKKGALNLYGLTDVYRFGIARYLLDNGFTSEAANRILAKIQDVWLLAPDRGHLRVRNVMSPGYEVTHQDRQILGRRALPTEAFEIQIPFGRVLHHLDSRIAACMKGER